MSCRCNVRLAENFHDKELDQLSSLCFIILYPPKSYAIQAEGSLVMIATGNGIGKGRVRKVNFFSGWYNTDRSPREKL